MNNTCTTIGSLPSLQLPRIIYFLLSIVKAYSSIDHIKSCCRTKWDEICMLMSTFTTQKWTFELFVPQIKSNDTYHEVLLFVLPHGVLRAWNLHFLTRESFWEPSLTELDECIWSIKGMQKFLTSSCSKNFPFLFFFRWPFLLGVNAG